MNNTAIVLPFKKEKIDLNLLKFFSKKYQNYCAEQNELKTKKIKALTEKAYDYYLNLYFSKLSGAVDIAEALYRAKVTICLFACHMAQIQMEKVIEEGRVDECYLKMRKQYRRAGMSDRVAPSSR